MTHILKIKVKPAALVIPFVSFLLFSFIFYKSNLSPIVITVQGGPDVSSQLCFDTGRGYNDQDKRLPLTRMKEGLAIHRFKLPYFESIQSISFRFAGGANRIVLIRSIDVGGKKIKSDGILKSCTPYSPVAEFYEKDGWIIVKPSEDSFILSLNGNFMDTYGSLENKWPYYLISFLFAISSYFYIRLCQKMGYPSLAIYGFIVFSFFNALFLYVITRSTEPFFVYLLTLILSTIGCLFLLPLYRYFLRRIPPLLEGILAHLKLGSTPEPHEARVGNEQRLRIRPSLIRRKHDNLSRISYDVILVMILTIGCYLRAKCYLNPNTSLWADESNVLIWFLNDGLFHTIFEKIPTRPIGYMFLSFFLMKTYNIDWLIKLSSFIPSVLSLVIVCLLSRRMFQSRIMSLVAVFMVSTNVQLIFFGNEFKPYELEFFLHLLTLYSSVKYIQEGSRASLGFALSSCFISIFFTLNILFALPSVMLVLSMISLRERRYDHFFVILLSSLFFLAYVALIAGFLWSHIEAGTREVVQFYGNKYQTFYLGDRLLSHIWWFVQKTGELIYKSLESKSFLFPSIHWASVLTVPYSLLYIVGLVLYAARKKYEYGVLFLFPVLVAILLNFLNVMPYGPDRVNLYLFAYFPILVLLPIDSLYAINNKALKILLSTAILVFFFSLHFPYQPNFFKYKLFWSTQTFTKQAIRYIHEDNKKEPAQAVCLSAPSIRPFNYYTRFARGYSEKYGQDLIRDFQIYEMWTQADQEISKFMKEIFVNNKIVYVYLANPSTKEEESIITDSLKRYSTHMRSYLLENSHPVEGVGEKIFYAESLIYQDEGKRVRGN